jgi:hypothetical protein
MPSFAASTMVRSMASEWRRMTSNLQLPAPGQSLYDSQEHGIRHALFSDLLAQNLVEKFNGPLTHCRLCPIDIDELQPGFEFLLLERLASSSSHGAGPPIVDCRYRVRTTARW